MSHFTEEQLQELVAIFGLKRQGDVLPVRDGFVSHNSTVWWRSENGPECLVAILHWENIRQYPKSYQLQRPATKTVYKD